MRILHVNKFLYRRGGAEGYLLDVAAAQRARGDEVGFFGMAHPLNDAPQRFAAHFPPRVELDPAPRGVLRRAAVAGRMVWSPRSRRGLARTLAQFRPDVVHLHNIYHQLSPSVLRAARAAGVPAVLTLHDYKLACPNYRLLAGGRICDACVTGGPWQAARRRCKDGSLGQSALLAGESWLHRALAAYGPVAAFLAPSRFLADVMRRAGVFPERLRVLPLFVEPGPGKERPGGGVVYAGRLSPEKGVDTLIEAVGRLDGGTLDIAGEGPSRAELQALAGEVAPGRVRFHGRLARADLHALIRTAAVAAVPSRWHENAPLAVLEAFACGVPVVATSLGGLPELVRDGVDGAIVPPADPDALAAALGGLLRDPDRALALGRAGRDLVARDFTPDAHLARLDAVYAEVRHAGARR
ncbi:glycosyltransferase [Virgisporangium aliadipatigenens]|nr:glycosyltransferase [Virgisporangium aliadipatigenens]